MIATHVNHLDALGQPVVIGNRYGYSVSSNGSTTVVTGKLVSTAKESVRIQPDTETNYYGNRRSDRPTDKNPRNVRSCILFPTPTYEENDLGNGITLRYLWDEIDRAIGGVVEVEDPRMQNLQSVKHIVKGIGDRLSAVFRKVQDVFDTEEQRRIRGVYEAWKKDPTSVDTDWQRYFDEATADEVKKACGL